MGIHVYPDKDDSSLCVCYLEGRTAGGSKLMFMLFEIFSILYGFGTFSETCHTAAYSHLYK